MRAKVFDQDQLDFLFCERHSGRWLLRRSLIHAASSFKTHTEKMKATVFQGGNDIRIEEIERPYAGICEALIPVTLTTICGTDLHIVRGEYPVKPGLVIGHEPVGVIEELGPGLSFQASLAMQPRRQVRLPKKRRSAA